MRNPRKKRSNSATPGEAARSEELLLRQRRPWEDRSFDAALTSMSQFR